MQSIVSAVGSNLSSCSPSSLRVKAFRSFVSCVGEVNFPALTLGDSLLKWMQVYLFRDVKRLATMTDYLGALKTVYKDICKSGG